jgi:hypothetical protein
MSTQFDAKHDEEQLEVASSSSADVHAGGQFGHISGR